MANLATISLILTISCLLAFTPDVYARKQGSVVEEDTSYFHEICSGNEKVLRLRFYVQDLGTAHPNTTVYEVATASITSTSPTSFGSIKVIDDKITEAPEDDSRELGRIQGVNTKSDLSVVGITISLNVVFTTGKFNGSTISIIGRNQFALAERELPVAGGSGVFRFARGYAIQTTHSMAPNVVVLEYNIYTTYNAKFVEPRDVEIAEM